MLMMPSTSNGAGVHIKQEVGLDLGELGCAVCGDKVNGNRYGVPACLGCIVFFRRAIVRGQQFACQRLGGCEIDFKSRCSCRACRLNKCITVGMNPMSIQRRDQMGPRKKKIKEEVESPESITHNDYSPRPPSLPMSVGGRPDPLLQNLFEIQQRQRTTHGTWFAARGPHSPHPSFVDGIADLVSALTKLASGDWPPPAPPPVGNNEYHTKQLRRARKHDVNAMFHLAIVDSVEFADRFEIFKALNLAAKREVLKEFAVAFMLVDQGYNTCKGTTDPTLWLLQHDRVFMCVDYMYGLPEEDHKLPHVEAKIKLHKDFVGDFVNGIGIPMREMQTEPFECAVLKCLLLFECHNVYPPEHRIEVAGYREKALLSLAAYESIEHPNDGIERIGQLLLMIANIRTAILTCYRQVNVSEIFELMHFDPLVKDVMLSHRYYLKARQLDSSTLVPEKQRSYRLVYFDAKGRAEIIRLIFKYFDVPFEDKRVTHEEFAKLKSDAPFEQLPILEIDDGKVVLSDSIGIARFLCKTFEHGFIGKTKTDTARADMVVYACSDCIPPIYMMMTAKPEEKEAKAEACKVALTRFLNGCERILKKNGGKHFVGEDITWADLFVLNMLWTIEDLKVLSITKKEHPTLHAFYQRIRKNDRIKDYISENWKSS